MDQSVSPVLLEHYGWVGLTHTVYVVIQEYGR